MFETWAKVFGIPEEEKDTILYMVADFIKLVQETKISIGKLENRKTEIYLRPFAQIEKALKNLNLNQGIEIFFREIEPTALYKATSKNANLRGNLSLPSFQPVQFTGAGCWLQMFYLYLFLFFQVGARFSDL